MHESTVVNPTKLVVLGVSMLVGLLAWSDDFITLQGERIVYTVECRHGDWQGKRCSGQLVASERFGFKTVKARREVLFWTVGVDETSGKFTDCLIEDGRNWTCAPTADTSLTVTRELVHGQPVADSSGFARPLRAVAKWRWWLLRWGISLGNQASD